MPLLILIVVFIIIYKQKKVKNPKKINVDGHFKVLNKVIKKFLKAIKKYEYLGEQEMIKRLENGYIDNHNDFFIEIVKDYFRT